MTRLLAVPLDASDVFLMTFMIPQDSYMEPTRVGSDWCFVHCTHPALAADFLATTCRHIVILYCCTSTCYSHHKVLLLSHLCSEKIRPSAHTHSAADPVHRYKHILINLHGAMLSQIYMLSCSSLPEFPHYPSLLHVGYTSMFRLEHFQI